MQLSIQNRGYTFEVMQLKNKIRVVQSKMLTKILKNRSPQKGDVFHSLYTLSDADNLHCSIFSAVIICN